jgi:hypothetical protein
MSNAKQSDLGSVYQRGSDGKWVASLRIGGGRRVTRYAPTRKEAQQVL